MIYVFTQVSILLRPLYPHMPRELFPVRQYAIHIEVAPSFHLPENHRNDIKGLLHGIRIDGLKRKQSPAASKTNLYFPLLFDLYIKSFFSFQIKEGKQAISLVGITVSKVVNGLPVGNSYKICVENAIKKLNYQVNSYAQGLKANKTHTIALLIPNTQEPFFASLVYHINLALLKRKYRMLLCSTDYDSGQEQEYVTMVQQNKVDGIIGLTYNPNLVIEGSTSFVSIDRSINPKIPCVTSDNFAGGQFAANKLADLGCKNLVFLRIGSSLENEPDKRRAGFENACLSLGLKYEMKLINDGEPFEEFDSFLAEHIHEGKLSFDGIFCVTDSLAYYVIKTLRRLHQRVPEAMSLS